MNGSYFHSDRSATIRVPKWVFTKSHKRWSGVYDRINVKLKDSKSLDRKTVEGGLLACTCPSESRDDSSTKSLK
jgi:hypothetical protein